MKRCKGIQDQADQVQGGQNMRRSDGARFVRRQSAEGVLIVPGIGGTLGKKIGQEKAFGGVQRGQIQKGAGQSGAVSGAMHGLFGLGDGTDLQLLQMGQCVEGAVIDQLAQFQFVLCHPLQPLVKCLPQCGRGIRCGKAGVQRDPVHAHTTGGVKFFKGNIQRGPVQMRGIKDRASANRGAVQDMKTLSVCGVQNCAVFQRNAVVVCGHGDSSFILLWAYYKAFIAKKKGTAQEIVTMAAL